MHLIHSWQISTETDALVYFRCSVCQSEKVEPKPCPHIWKETHKETHPSLLDSLGSGGKLRGYDISEARKRDVVVSYRCSLCGSEKTERI